MHVIRFTAADREGAAAGHAALRLLGPVRPAAGAWPWPRAARRPLLDDDQALDAIQAIPGFGLWSAQIYLMFSLGRPDVWPRGDVCLLNGLQKIKQLPERPAIGEDEALVQALRPHRSLVALLAWKCAVS